MTDKVIANNLYTNVQSNSNTFLWTPPPNLYTSNTFAVNVVIEELGGYANTVNTVWNGFGYNAATIVTISSISNTYLDSGQYVTFTLQDTGGTGKTFQTELINATPTTPVQQATNIIITCTQSALGCTGSATNTITSFKVFSATNGNVFKFNAITTDTGTTTPFTNNTIVSSITVNTALVASAPTETNVIIDLLQYSLQTAQPSGGTLPYRYQWYTIAGSTAPTCTASNSIIGATSNTYLAQPLTTNSYAYELTDSATTNVVLCSNGNTIIVNPDVVANTILSNTLLDSGQTETIKLTTLGGTSPFTANLVNVTGGTRQGARNVIISTVGGSNSISFVVSSATNSNTFTYQWNGIDYGTTTNDPFTSPSNTITVNAVFNTIGITTPSPSIQLVGNALLWSGSFTGGTSPYTYNWNVYNSITNVILGNYLVTNSYTSNSFSWPIPSSAIGNTINANLIITDSATTPVTVNSVLSGSISILSGVLSPSVSSLLILGIPSTITATFGSSITLPLTYNWIVQNSITGAILANALYNNVNSNVNSFTFTPSWIGNELITVTVNDPTTLGGNYNVYVPLNLANYSDTNVIINPVNTIISALPMCANTIGGTCQGNDIISTTNTLISNLYVNGNFTLVKGKTLTTNGFLIAVSQVFNSVGANIIGGVDSNLAVGLAGTSPTQGGNAMLSYGGSGGGGGSGGTSGVAGANGGNALIVGGIGGAASGNPGNAGSNVIIPTLTTANIILYCSNIATYLVGVPGGGGSNGNGDASGGNANTAIYGICIIANTLKVGVINTNGLPGLAGGSTINANPGGGGGGGSGGAPIILANGIGGYTAGTYNTMGGAGGAGGTTSGGANGGAGGAGGNGQVQLYQNSILPILPPLLNWYYPYLFTTNSPSNTITYTFNQIYNGGTPITLENSVLNVNYFPPSNQPAGFYQYGLTEMQYSNSITFNMTNLIVNMTTVTTFLTTNIPAFQYYPVQLVSNTLAFSVQASNYVIDGYGNTPIGVNIIKGSPTTTLSINMQLNYPIGSFNVSNSVDLAVPSSIQLTAFGVFNSPTTPASPNTRKIFTMTIQNEQTFALVNASTTFSFTGILNNYSISNSITFTGNFQGIFVPSSPFINPPINFTSITGASKNSSTYFQTQNNYCQLIETSTQAENLYGYLVATALGQSTTINVQSNFAGANNGDFLQVWEGATFTFGTLVQQVIISSQSFALPLIVGNSYGFKILNSNCNQIYSISPLPQTNPININIPINITSYTFPVPNATVTCNLVYNSIVSANTAVCSGYDTTKLINNWTISLYNSGGFVGQQLIVTNTISGSKFNYTYYPIPYNTGPVQWQVTARWTSPDPSNSLPQTWTGYFNFNIAPGYNTPLDTIIIIIFLLIGIAAGNQIGGAQHKLSSTLFIEALLVTFMYMVGLSAWLTIYANAPIIIFLVIVGILGYMRENASILGQ